MPILMNKAERTSPAEDDEDEDPEVDERGHELTPAEHRHPPGLGRRIGLGTFACAALLLAIGVIREKAMTAS